MKIYVMTDLEGVSGVVAFEDRKDESPWNVALRQKYSRLLAGEVNAAVEGAFAAGATEVLIDDSHGGGYTIDVELLDERARILHGRERPRIMAGLDESFDGMLIVGAHAMAGTRGAVLYHTMSCDTRQIRLNGRPVGEIGIFAFVAGAFGVPTLMVTGDSAACREAAALIPNITTVAVKEGLSRYAAIAYPPGCARAMIREAAEVSIRRRKSVAPYVLDPPLTYQVDGFAEDSDCRVSDPARLPATWTTGDEIRAASAEELIRKVWGREV
jgi:D-amino peptidase